MTFYDQDAPENQRFLPPDERLALRLHWKGCTLVNPLCPDDVCVLPAGHADEHVLGTENPDYRFEKTAGFWIMAVPGSTLRDLIAIGARKQREMFPEASL